MGSMTKHPNYIVISAETSHGNQMYLDPSSRNSEPADIHVSLWECCLDGIKYVHIMCVCMYVYIYICIHTRNCVYV